MKKNPLKAAWIKAAFLFLFSFLISCQVLASNVKRFIRTSGSLFGKVIDLENQKPIDFARIILLDLNKIASTDSDGNFLIEDIPSGTYQLQVYRLGFRSSEITFSIKDNETTQLLIELLSRPISAETVIVRAQRDDQAGIVGEAEYKLSGEKLRQSLGQTIAKTIDGEPGMSQRSMGPAPARPVLRGLGGDRLLILEDGARTGDLSATSNDHAVVLDPLNADQIEIYRGPEALQFGSNTIAGVINVWNRNISTHMPEKANVVVTTQTESVNNGISGGLSTNIPYKEVAFNFSGSARTATDMQTPEGKLKNTGIDSYRASGGLSWIKPWGFLGVSGSVYAMDYGIPGGFIGAHPNGVDITMQRKQVEIKSSYLANTKLLHHIDFGFNLTEYYHQEYESNGSLGVEFGVITYASTLSFHSNEMPWGTSTWGIWGQYRDYANGGFVFTPDTKEQELAAYWYNEKAWDKLRLETAFRYDIKSVSPDENRVSRSVGLIRDRSFNSWSGAFELSYLVDESIELGTRFMRTFRAPGVEELFSEGPHLAAYSYEIGSADNTIEVGYNSEVFLAYKSNRIHSEVSVYRNQIENYLFPQDIDSLQPAKLLPIYQFAGLDAVFYGAEIHTELDWSTRFSSSFTASYTWAEFTKTNEAVPFIPPFSGKVQFNYKNGDWNYRLLARYAAAQNRTGVFEEATNGFVVLGSGFEYVKSKWGGLHMISVNFENMLNATYRNHLSRVKSVMPEPGFNASVLYRVYF